MQHVAARLAVLKELNDDVVELLPLCNLSLGHWLARARTHTGSTMGIGMSCGALPSTTGDWGGTAAAMNAVVKMRSPKGKRSPKAGARDGGADQVSSSSSNDHPEEADVYIGGVDGGGIDRQELGSVVGNAHTGGSRLERTSAQVPLLCLSRNTRSACWLRQQISDKYG